MAQTAVGLFEHTHDVDLVLNGLRAEGIPSESVRVISNPSGMAVDSMTSTPSVDFRAALCKDLLSMGATADECEAYVSSVKSGSLMMFVTGTGPEADKAAALMNENGAVQIEEFAGAVPMLPSIHVGEIAATGGISLKEDRTRAKSEGARVFTW